MRVLRDVLRLGLVLVFVTSSALAEEAVTFELKPFNPLEKPAKDDPFDRIPYDLHRGARSWSVTEPDTQVKAYPALKSERPYYGTIRFDHNHYEPEAGLVLHYVVDESEGTGKGYDRFYFDANRDLDLTNDPVLRPAKKGPSGLRLMKKEVLFENVRFDWDYGRGIGKRTIEIVPVFTVTKYKGKPRGYLRMISTVAMRGEIRIGSAAYSVILGSNSEVMPRLDRALAGLFLHAVDSSSDANHWWGADMLGAFRCVDNKWYTVSASPTGDRITVKPYDGPMGVLEIGPGERQFDTLGMRGSLNTAETAVPVGRNALAGTAPPVDRAVPKNRCLAMVRRCRLPVGDYTVCYLNVDYGPLKIALSQNYHCDGKYLGWEDRPVTFGFKIREDKPFVLDFSTEPALMFTKPAREETFAPGDTVKVEAVLIDPVLDIMIRGLTRTVPEAEKKEGDASDADKEPTEGETKDPPEVVPTVVITDSSGRRVAEGTMPFG